MPDISLVMPCYNRSYDLRKILSAYEHQAGDELFEIIAVDDGSRDSTFEILSSYQPSRFSLRPVHQETNQGPAKARNLGISLATAPLVLFVGDDILPDPFLIRGHLAQHRRYPAQEVVVLGRVQWPNDLPINTLMQHIDGIGAQQFSYYYFKDEAEYDFRHFYTANVSIKADFLKQTDKGFDTDFQYAAFEDVELSYRLAKRGLRIIYSFHPLGYHFHYHTIWSFSTRQYRAGLMACVLIRKHPELRSLIMGRSWRFRLLQWRLLAQYRSPSAEAVSRLENQFLHWLSAHEWTPHPKLDLIYLTVLRYYYYKGLITGIFGETPLANRITNICSQKILLPVASQLTG